MGRNIIGLLLGCLIGGAVGLYGVNHSSPAITPVYYNSEMLADLEATGEVITRVKEPEFVYLPMVNLSEEDQEKIFTIANSYNIAYTLILSMIETESSCNVSANSSTGDHGLMQINEINHKRLYDELGITDYYDLEENVEAGCFILSELFEEYREVHEVLMAYNMGERGASKLWRQGVHESQYSKKIVDREIELSEFIDGVR